MRRPGRHATGKTPCGSRVGMKKFGVTVFFAEQLSLARLLCMD